MTTHSPFPGFDPYLERYWGDVHHRLIQYSSDALQASLPADLVARVEERVYVENEGERLRNIAPDIFVTEWTPSALAAGGVATADMTVAPSVICHIQHDPLTEGFIEIRDADGDEVITVIEFLSPANKMSGEGMRQYRQKQAQVLQSNASLVEIDLIRSGQRVFAVDEEAIPAEWRRGALACVSRAQRKENPEVFAFPLRSRLLALPIPLRPKESPVLLDLQAIFDECYQKGRYARTDYRADPVPPLTGDDAAWADQLLKAAGRR